MFGKRKIAALAAEFLGTGVLTLLILSVQRSSIGLPFFVAAAAGLTLAMMMFALVRVSGGYFNPAITIAFWTARRIPTITAVLYVAVQMLGAWAAYYLFAYFFIKDMPVVGGHFTGRILTAEAIGTGILGFGIASAVYQRLSTAATAAYGGLALMLGSVAASTASIALLNPAVALGARAWVWGTYVVGPVIGAVIGVNLYALLFAEPEVAAATVRSAPAAVAAPAKKPTAKKKTTRAKK